MKTILDSPFHLGVELEDGSVILGQHRITGKEHAHLKSPIKHIWLNKGLRGVVPINRQIADDRRDMIATADLICYPPGSFYSSLLANLLPKGVGLSICDNPNPKVYIPNLGVDPEQIGLSLMGQVARLLSVIQRDLDGQSVSNTFSALDYLLLDDSYDYGVLDIEELSRLGVQVIKTPLIRHKVDRYDEALIVKALLSLT